MPLIYRGQNPFALPFFGVPVPDFTMIGFLYQCLNPRFIQSQQSGPRFRGSTIAVKADISPVCPGGSAIRFAVSGADSPGRCVLCACVEGGQDCRIAFGGAVIYVFERARAKFRRCESDDALPPPGATFCVFCQKYVEGVPVKRLIRTFFSSGVRASLLSGLCAHFLVFIVCFFLYLCLIFWK